VSATSLPKTGERVATPSVSPEVFTSHSASGREVQVAVARNSRSGPTHREAQRQSREVLCGSSPPGGARRWGAHESVVRSRPAEPGASRYPASARIDSSIAGLESRHRAPLLAEEELGVHEGEGCRRTPWPQAHRNGCGSYPTKLQVKPWNWATVTVTPERAEIGGISRSGAGARSSPSVPRAVASVFSA